MADYSVGVCLVRESRSYLVEGTGAAISGFGGDDEAGE